MHHACYCHQAETVFEVPALNLGLLAEISLSLSEQML